MSEENDKQTASHVEEAVPDTEIATTVSDVPPDFGSPEVADFPDVAFGEIDEDEDETPDPGEPEEDDDDGGSEEPVALDQAEPEDDDNAEEDDPILPPSPDEEEAEAGSGT
jgi:hypothetical protein